MSDEPKWKTMDVKRLTRAEFEAGMPCPACGLPLLDDLGAWPPLLHMSNEERAAHDEADRVYRERHGECHAIRWSMAGSRTWHCGNCCPPHPLSEEQLIERIATLLLPAITRTRSGRNE